MFLQSSRNILYLENVFALPVAVPLGIALVFLSEALGTVFSRDAFSYKHVEMEFIHFQFSQHLPIFTIQYLEMKCWNYGVLLF